MSRHWQIAADVFWSVIIVGFVAWIFICCLRRSESPTRDFLKLLFSVGLVAGDFYFVCSMTRHLAGGESLADYGVGFVIAGSVAVCGIILSILWTPQISGLLFGPLTDLFDGGRQPPDPQPYYSRALAKRKLHKPFEAIVEIRQQLAKFPGDFEGVMLLAGIQAEDTRDLPSAELTLNRFCDGKNAPPRQVAAALTQMADWHLKIANDVDAARAMLEKIISRFPKTELALQAAQRLAHLGGTEKILLAAHDRQAMLVPEGVKNIGLLDSTEFLRPAETDPKILAAELVKHLEQFPVDTEAREKLAVIYARHYQRLDLAALELAQLINEPGQPPKRVAHWLNLLADLQVRGGAGYEAVRATLEKIGEQFPESAAAQLAQSRLNRLKLELKGQTETPAKPLGVYEQNLGLKYGAPRRL